MTIDGTNKRAAILQAALELFTERGVDGTVIPMIAERAGVGTGTIYRYFVSKEELGNAVYQEWKGRFYHAITDGFPTHAPALTRFQFLWAQMVQFALQNPTAFTFLETHHHAPYLNEASHAALDKVMRFLRAFMEDLIEQQIAKPLPADALVAMVLGAFIGLFKAVHVGSLILTPAIIEAIGQGCWESIRR